MIRKKNTQPSELNGWHLCFVTNFMQPLNTHFDKQVLWIIHFAVYFHFFLSVLVVVEETAVNRTICVLAQSLASSLRHFHVSKSFRSTAGVVVVSKMLLRLMLKWVWHDFYHRTIKVKALCRSVILYSSPTKRRRIYAVGLRSAHNSLTVNHSRASASNFLLFLLRSPIVVSLLFRGLTFSAQAEWNHFASIATGTTFSFCWLSFRRENAIRLKPSFIESIECEPFFAVSFLPSLCRVREVNIHVETFLI